jgi:tRNA (guanosine-2'-O-)-methyltransferase
LDSELQSYLESLLTPERFERVQDVLNNRTRYLTVVLEDLSNPLNANAAIRTMDCFGLQDLHVIENRHLFERDQRTSKGTIKWVDVFKHTEKVDNSKKCLAQLKAKGYRIVSTSPHATKSVHDLDYSQPLAFVFGNESDGVSQDIIDATDDFVSIPMYGFAESYNISVSVALVLQTARYQMENKVKDWQLSAEERAVIYDEWLPKAVNHSDLIIQRFLEDKEK